MAEFKLEAKKREGTGKNKVDKMRVEKLIPSIVYSKGKESQPIVVDSKDFDKIYLEAGTSNIIELDIEGINQPALIKEVQKHPFKNQYLHVDFQGVDMSVKMKVFVPIVLEGRDSIRVQPSVLMQLVNEVEVECLPADLPSEAIVNVENMQIGENITIKDLDVFSDSKVEVLTDLEEVVATLSEPREEVIEEDVDVEAGEVPTVGETEESSEE
ncbi:50S ribosomal protein L25 [Miniphocaeibacter massiliensis]|uniref:50S ribosomal protein L25 n=1 Tax=Miniphocaeibacter massiliensis TaxID=2041841 RepID=UPI000C1BBF6D|nr:50S ribosomal protein L25 [Miniphocaeibacter massiliensis]